MVINTCCYVTISIILAILYTCSSTNITDINNLEVSLIPYENSSMMLFDFTTLDNLDNWHESSDTTREVGMSKASFVLQKTQKYQRAIFFALLNPQPNGACFAGFRTEVNFDSSNYDSIQMRLKGAQGDIWRYKLVLTHQHQSTQHSYHTSFNVSELCDCRQVKAACHCEHDIVLPLKDFKGCYRGKFDPNAPPLNSTNVGSVGIQAAGGVYEEQKQHGVGSIEIDWIKLISPTSYSINNLTQVLNE